MRAPMKAVFSLFALAFLLVAAAISAQESAPSPSQAAAKAQQSQEPQNSKPSPNQNQLPTISVTSGLVHLVVTVTDRRRSFVTDLDQSDFKVLENGNPQDIRFFGRETDLPLRIGLLIDTSNSIRPRLSFEQEAAIDFL